MVAAAVAHLRGREAIVSGQPEVLLATPGSAASMETLGLDVGHPDPTGRHPLYLVIVQGDLDAALLFPGGGDSRRLVHVVALLFDLAHGASGDVASVLARSDGAVFAQALNDPALLLPD